MVVLILRWGAFVTLAILMASFSAFAQSPQVQRLGGDQGELKFIFAPPEGASSIPEAFFLTAKGGAVAGPRIRVTQLSRESAQLPTRAVTFRFPARTATLRPDVATPVAVDFDPEILSNAGTYTGRLVVEEKVGKNALPRLVLNFTVTRPDAKLKIVPESPTVVLKRLCPFLCGSLYLTDVFRVDLWTFDASARIRGITPARLSSSTDGITDGRITATLGGPNSTGEISVGKPQALELVVQGLSRAGKYEGTLVIQGD
ncbi:MAG TPA: hypothetical protein VFF86_09260, partial [Candidatus Methylomirabilis sp.]|nr:hypothetical protein [Candidatus Methylomirabilis sp.]